MANFVSLFLHLLLLYWSYNRFDSILCSPWLWLFSSSSQEISLTLLNEYTDWNRPNNNQHKILDLLNELLTDALVVSPLIKTLNLHSTQSTAKSYMYTFQPSNNDSDNNNRTHFISGYELNFIFGAPLINDGKQLSYFSTKYTKSDIYLSQIMISFWTQFARNG